MAVFKEIKKRINSIKSTRKTTSAMKMVASSKLHKAESLIQGMLPYSEAMNNVMQSLICGDSYGGGDLLGGAAARGGDSFGSGTVRGGGAAFGGSAAFGDGDRRVENVAVAVFSSDSSLCGAFNSNIFRELQKTVDEYRRTLRDENIFVYTVGKKVFDAVRKTGINIAKNFENLAGKPNYGVIAEFGDLLLKQFEANEVDRVELIYHHFRSAGFQEIVRRTLLPVDLSVRSSKERRSSTDYIFEPSRAELLKAMIPKSVKLQLYTVLLDSNASEHAARMIAMQTATDNADDLITELTIEYNKSRQQSITNELLDLMNN
jgi:F-type H+-transporting ATPase subunit gamma